MENKLIFRDRLTEMKEFAAASGNILSEEEVRGFFDGVPPLDEHFASIFQYLKEQGILIADTTEEAQDAREQGKENALSYYLKELEQISGRDLAEIADDTFFSSAEEERQVCEAAARGDRKARELLTEKYLPMVCMIAQEYEGTKLPVEDLIQEGNLGLYTALTELEELSSLAAYRAFLFNGVRGAILEAVRANADYRDNGEKITEKLNRLHDAAQSLEEELGHKVSAEDLSAALGEPVEEILDLLKLTGIDT